MAPRLTRRLPLLCWLTALVGICGPMFLPGQTLGFRDVGHYYPPLMRHVQQAWRMGVPLWNNLEERGRPLLADPTAATLYPGRLLLGLPLKFEVVWELFLVSHLLIAAWGVFRVGAAWKWSAASSTLASVVYAFGGFVAFQLHNPPYLIGAAWLPWVIRGAEMLCDNSLSLRGILSLVLPLTLMILGGDVQTAYVSGPVILVGMLGKCMQRRTWRLRFQAALPSMGRLALAWTVVVLLTAAQWLPTWRWAQSSDRTTATGQAHSLVRYDYSMGPWLWFEMVFPNGFGRVAPQLTRWIQALPAEGRAWTPSLYMSLIGLGLAVRSIGGKHDAPRRRWLWFLVLLGALASLGRFGLGWLWKEVAHGLGSPPPGLEDAWGGLYWLLAEWAPGFGVFRYPAKMWLWTALGLSLLAGQSLESRSLWLSEFLSRLSDDRRWPAWRRFGLPCLLVVAGVALMVFAVTRSIEALASLVPADRLFGPLNVPETRNTLLLCGLHVASAGIVWIAWNRWTVRRGPMSEWMIVALVVVDLVVAHHRLIPLVPTQNFLSAASPADMVDRESLRYLREPKVWYPEHWTHESSADRMERCVEWDQQTLRPKHHLDQGWSALRSSTSFSSNSQMGFLQVLDETRATEDSAWLEMLRAVSCDMIVASSDDPFLKSLQVANKLHVDRTTTIDGASVAHWRITQTVPRAWLVPEADWRSELADLDGRSVEEWARCIRAAWLPESGLDRLLQRVTIHADAPQTLPSGLQSNDEPAPSVSSCRCLEDLGSTQRYEVQSSAATWLVLNEAFAPGWTARLIDHSGAVTDVPVYRANELMMTLPVAPGEYRVELSYEPPEWYWGVACSLTTLAMLGMVMMSKLLVVSNRRSAAVPPAIEM